MEPKQKPVDKPSDELELLRKSSRTRLIRPTRCAALMAGMLGVKSMKFSIGKSAFAGRTGRRPVAEPDTLQRIDVFASRGDAENATGKERRARILQLLYCRHAAEGEETVYRNALPPADWMNAQLEARGETWRVVGTSGTTCDVRELEAAQLV